MFLCHQKWESEKSIVRLTKPVLFLTGAADELVPTDMMNELFRLCPSTSKKLVTFPGGTHNDTCLQDGYFDAIEEFWNEFVASPEGASKIE